MEVTTYRSECSLQLEHHQRFQRVVHGDIVHERPSLGLLQQSQTVKMLYQLHSLELQYKLVL